MNDPGDLRSGLGLAQIINAAGTMTAIGASAAVPEAIAAAAGILPCFIDISELQRLASDAIARATGAEAGFVTASASAGVTLAVAGTMTGADPGRIERLPDTRGMRSRVVIQLGHLINYGAPLDQAIRLAGATVSPVGQATSAQAHQLAAALDDTVAAAVFVASHHVVPYGQIPLRSFVEVCAARDVPVIVDAASEYDITGFIAAGADIVVISAHKFLGGLTAGIVAGRKSLVRAAYLQNGGIGRGMKVGKEGVAGAIAALEAWSKRDHAQHRRREEARIAFWLERLSRLPGLRLEVSPDPTGNPITRLRLWVGPASGTNAWDLAENLAAGRQPVIVRDDEIDLGYVELDPCNLREGEAEEVAERIAGALEQLRTGGQAPSTLEDWQAGRLRRRLAWPDRE